MLPMIFEPHREPQREPQHQPPHQLQPAPLASTPSAQPLSRESAAALAPPGVALRWVGPLLAGAAAMAAAGLAFALVQGLAWSAGAAAALSAAAVVLVLAWPVFIHLNRLADHPHATLVPEHASGTASKAMFLDLAERERSRARRYGSGAALLLVDVDRSARLSEVHGAAAAHAVLRELARQTSPTLRGADTLTLFGPTQMAVFLAQADATGALDVAERIRERAEHLQTPLPGNGPAQALHATVSVGVAQLRPAHLHLQALINDAEDAVLAARQVGGNCVRAAPPVPNPQQTPSTPRNDHRARPQ